METDETAPKRIQLENEDGQKTDEKDTDQLDTSTTSVEKPSTIQIITELPMAQIVESALSMIRSAMVNEPSPPLHVNWAHWLAGSSASLSLTAASLSTTVSVSSPSKMPKQQAVEVCKIIVLQVSRNFMF